MLYLNKTLTGKIRVHPHDRFIRCQIKGVVFQGDAAGAVWHGCTGAADFSDLKRIGLARMFGRNDFRGSTWPQGEAMAVILGSLNQHDMLRAMLDDIPADAPEKEVAQRCVDIILTSYHPDNSWVPVIKMLDSEFGEAAVRATWESVGITEVTDKFNWTKGEISAVNADPRLQE
ncbi:hypothetical protein LCGC14_1534560 [marine sediment metagenome]|uniref:Uncharacterized protein n=1 Tax=marine sediment metagenome TaxID=412755 RepID=A0A0F9JFR1_9ZZZZ